ncbi:MAG: tetratricopeptide repeat protein [Acetivibrio ethanolgignens]
MGYPDFDHIRKASNMYYNSGLEKAKVRDLSGAVDALKKSLKLNKMNTRARNLLGLVYYEMGEVVNALSEWVISKHFEEDNEMADRYIAAIQRNPSRLETINQTIKKYNRALEYAKQGNSDLAILQLEKVVSLNPHFVRSYQLLALLYMQSGNNKKAVKCLSKALKIDRNNTVTLKYRKELSGGSEGKAEEKEEWVKDRSILHEQENGGQVFKAPSYKEERFNFWPYANFFLGAVLGILVVYFLIVPTVKKQVATEYETKFKAYSDDMASQDITFNTLKRENEGLKAELESLNRELEELKGKGMDESLYDNFYKAIRYYMDGEKEEAAKQLADVKESALENAEAKNIYNTIKGESFEAAAEELAEEGRVIYNQGKYDEALEKLQDALKLDPANVKAIYFTGRVYHRQGDKEKAAEYYNKVINDYPDSERAAEAKRRLSELGL